jgi:LysR family transcriptional regulator, transcriptional activator of nhaA
MSISFNYKHLYYFWVVAKEGGISRAAQKLDMAVQTISSQVRELEQSLGYALLKPAGRGLVLTEAGHAAMLQADLIFQLGENLPARVRDAVSSPAVRLAVGICDGLPKLVVHRLLLPVIGEPHLRLLCHEGELNELLGDLALHRLDIVLSDRPAPVNPNIKLYSHAMGASPIGWYGTSAHVQAALQDFPQSLADVPVLLPTAHTAMRGRLDKWFEQRAIRPRIVGEFEDGALLKTFGASGMGVFPAAEWVHDDLLAHYAVERLGHCDGVIDHFYAIGTEKKVQHPLVQRLVQPSP